jgi:predicted cupin superfamily sugar epimerase
MKQHETITADFFINQLQLQPHPEGGYYRETYRATESIAAGALPARFVGARSFGTSIYYLLQQGDYSAFHRIKSDECWHFYAGDALLIHLIDLDASYRCVRLGDRIEQGDVFQFVVPAMAWFAAEPARDSAFALVGCTVAPGFDFNDFQMGDKAKLTSDFPQHAHIIERLCKLKV